MLEIYIAKTRSFQVKNSQKEAEKNSKKLCNFQVTNSRCRNEFADLEKVPQEGGASAIRYAGAACQTNLMPSRADQQTENRMLVTNAFQLLM